MGSRHYPTAAPVYMPSTEIFLIMYPARSRERPASGSLILDSGTRLLCANSADYCHPDVSQSHSAFTCLVHYGATYNFIFTIGSSPWRPSSQEKHSAAELFREAQMQNHTKYILSREQESLEQFQSQNIKKPICWCSTVWDQTGKACSVISKKLDTNERSKMTLAPSYRRPDRGFKSHYTQRLSHPSIAIKNLQPNREGLLVGQGPVRKER